jgi:hypothetical protein
MKLCAQLVFLAALGMIDTPTTAQESSQSTATGLSEVTWTSEGSYEWSRPLHVRYVLIRARGGGAGAATTTTLLGPFSSDRYTIVIGRGGSGGASKVASRSSNDPKGSGGEGGTPTSFTGEDLSFGSPGGFGGTAGKAQSRMSAGGTMYEFVVTRAGGSGGMYPGGGTAQDGARGDRLR